MTGTEILNLAQTIAISLTFIILAFQLRHHVKSTKSLVYSSIMRRIDEVNKISIQNPEFEEGLKKPYPENQKMQVDMLAYTILNLYEELFFSYKEKFIRKETWEGWKITIRKDMNLPYINGFWKENKQQYSSSFVDFVDELTNKIN